ncbi:DUF397 domain-containing protein [Streptomyces mirabilis]|uniref:DUF397 domain-containing protein n=1 Tax=Streptomyces mirabilis TaxID=68239 RepID=UPI00364EEDDD
MAVILMRVLESMIRQGYAGRGLIAPASTGRTTECLEIATSPTTLHLRESDHPTTVLSPTPTALRALLEAVKRRGVA